MTFIYIDNEGNLTGLADDYIDKLNMGHKEVKRVSDVEFDHASQQWEAVDNAGKLIATHPIRSEVIELERKYFNNQIEAGFALAASC